MPALAPRDPALDAYDALGDAYDRFTAHHDHDRWLSALLEIAARHAPPPRSALDVGCGTGKSFVPLLERGIDVTACDLSPAMAAHARRRHPLGGDAVHVCDMRRLPREWGPFDLVACLDDAVNYLLGRADLEAAFRSAAAVLAPGGLYVFDVNTLATYRTVFSTTFVQQAPDAWFCWQGHGDGTAEPEGLHEATLEAFLRDDETADAWRRHSSRHVQRHFSAQVIAGALAAVGLDLVDAVGQRAGAALGFAPSEDADSKLVYVARKRR